MYRDRFVTEFASDGNPSATGLYQGSLAYFSEWREDIKSGGRSVWVDCTRTVWNQHMAVESVEDCMNTVRRSLGFSSGVEDNSKKVIIGCEWDQSGNNKYADTKHIADCPSRFCRTLFEIQRTAVARALIPALCFAIL